MGIFLRVAANFPDLKSVCRYSDPSLPQVSRPQRVHGEPLYDPKTFFTVGCNKSKEIARNSGTH